MKAISQNVFHVAGLQFVNPIGTWRLSCIHANQGTRYHLVQFVPSWARVAYRATETS